MILVVDNFDSFTYNLVDYFNQLGLETEVHRNSDPLSVLLHNKYSAVVLAPGHGIPSKAGNLKQVLDYYHNRVPILGICLGHQAIGEFFNGNIVKAHKPMHGKISEISQEGDDPLFRNIPTNFNVVRYHSLVCSNLSGDIKVVAKSKNGEVMAIKHKGLPIYGLQFHPEAVLTQYGLDILRNWKNIIGRTN